MNVRSILPVAAVLLFSSISVSEDWPRYRGPNGSGVAKGNKATPTKWAPESVLWKAEIKGAGVSSPIVVGDKVLVTSYSGYGESRSKVGKMDDLKRHLTCFDKKSGDPLWSKVVDPVLPEEPYSGAGIPAHGYASHTPVSDGKMVFAFFGRTGVVAFDLDGNKKWTKNVGKGNSPKGWGSASSPIVYDKYVIVPATAEDSAIVALDKETGKEVWKSKADGFYNSWSTPILSKVNDERTDIVFGVGYELWALNPANGKLRWYAEVHNSESFNSSIVENDGVIYAIEGRRGTGSGFAVKSGGNKDAKSNIVWNVSENGSFSTPVVHKDRVYHVANGIFKCLNAKDGKLVYQERLPAVSSAGRRGGSEGGGPGRGGSGRSGRGGSGRFGRGGGGNEYASPAVANDLLYYVQSNGNTVVIKLGDKYSKVASNKLTNDDESFGASPAISDGRIYIRSNRHLYCVGKTE